MSPPSGHTRSKGVDSEFRGVRLGRPEKTIKKAIKKAKQRKPASAPQLCRDYVDGKCQGGCSYAHPPVCRKILRGPCIGKCKYWHPKDSAVFEHNLRLNEIEDMERGTTKRDGTPAEIVAIVDTQEAPEHSASNKSERSKYVEGNPLCRYGVDCTNKRCRFWHPEHEDREAATGQQSAHYVEKNSACRYVNDCHRAGCRSSHLEGARKVTIGQREVLRPATENEVEREQRMEARPACYFGNACRRVRCRFRHPADG